MWSRQVPSELEEPTESGSGCKMWIAVFLFCISPVVDLGHVIALNDSKIQERILVQQLK